MKAMVLRETSPIEKEPLKMETWPEPVPRSKEILIQVTVCGICHTELDEIEGRLSPKLPVILGHQVIGRVTEVGPMVQRFKRGDRVGVAWIYSACGTCDFCQEGDENLCL
ncbi:MAG: alcohol dehydrogenase catalytic domain-containing protein, partial [Candidatus Methanomethylicaceae archaeon]